LRGQLEPHERVEDRRVGLGQPTHVDDDDRALRWFHVGDDRRAPEKSPMNSRTPEGLFHR
jgi:hypothetical protein